ncbi:type 4 fimbrial biogenesis relatedtransmembrane protein [Azoarcus olearius]|uniref:type IV pilus modification PilV family protein n=1 Tax=Azoarcus sp. (strain BH72) TaxID=418699 RepID=UPI0008060BD2|nr:type 4 fimbrial biosynthesis protein [Azoarcus olearius]ANQ85342.1 type 4 fimbrial biogenesis relatedtransmembrane protein [Azoarcus olearius]
MIEVMVTIVILVVGLLGVAGLQMKSQSAEMEAYQRAMAVAFVQDMTSRIAAGRGHMADYVTYAGASSAPTVYGTGDATDCDDATGALLEICEWSEAMRGGAETTDAGVSIAAPIGMRGCILAVDAEVPGALQEFFVVGVWQGLTPTADPPDDTPGALCASDVEFGAGLRRSFATRILVPDITG